MRPPNRGALEAELREATTLDDRLDEVRRARIWDESDGSDPDARAVRARRRTVIAAALVGGALAAAVLAALGARALWGEPERGGRHQATQIVEVPASATARAQLGAAAVVLHGPARMQVERADEIVELVLERGVVSGEYDGARGGRMRVRTPHAVVEVVGTLFDVEVERHATCVAVAHGEVAVRASAGVRAVKDGQSWCTDAVDVRAVEPAVEARMNDATVTSTLAPEALAAAGASPTSPSSAQPRLPPSTPTPTPLPPGPPSPRAARGVRDDAPAPTPSSAGSRSAPEPDVHGDARPIAVSPEAPAVPALPADVALYQQAERALRVGDTSLADALLARLVVHHPRSELVDDALFERARLAYAAGAWGAARASLDQLLDRGATPLRDAARTMLCRIAERTGDRDARRCFEALHREEAP